MPCWLWFVVLDSRWSSQSPKPITTLSDGSKVFVFVSHESSVTLSPRVYYVLQNSSGVPEITTQAPDSSPCNREAKYALHTTWISCKKSLLVRPYYIRMRVKIFACILWGFISWLWGMGPMRDMGVYFRFEVTWRTLLLGVLPRCALLRYRIPVYLIFIPKIDSLQAQVLIPANFFESVAVSWICKGTQQTNRHMKGIAGRLKSS